MKREHFVLKNVYVMKRMIKVLLILVLITSCESKKVNELNNRIFELEKLNKKLNDSLKRNSYKRLISSQLFGISEKNSLELNKLNRFKFMFSSLQTMPKYNVYKITKDGDKEKRTLIYEDYTKSHFEYNFTPKNKSENSFELKALFFLDTVAIEIPGVIKMPFKD